MLIVGIDEAGYGPVLGPLVISAVAFRLPDSLSQIPLWQVLTESVTDRPRRSGAKLVVADSKKLYRGRSDLRNLERSALTAVWAAHGLWPDDLGSLLETISIEPDVHLHHSWYCHQDLKLPRSADKDELGIASGLFVKELEELEGEVAGVFTVPVVEGRFNRLIDQMRSKSALLFSQTIRLVDTVIRGTDEGRVDVYLDKHGARNRYLPDLLRSFSRAELEVIEEGPTHSGYRLKFAGKVVHLHFLADGETRRLTIAWASIVSKYVRELFMVQFNSYWNELCPDLKPTAGYWTDGRRFLKDLAATLGKGQVPMEQLVRRS